jgi:hypothetical protein
LGQYAKDEDGDGIYEVYRAANRCNTQECIINWLIISTFGLQKNQYSTGLISNSLSMEDLF